MSTKAATQTEKFELELNIDAARAKVGRVDAEIAALEAEMMALQKAMLASAEDYNTYDAAHDEFQAKAKERGRHRIARENAAKRVRDLELAQAKGNNDEHNKRVKRLINKRAEIVQHLIDANTTEAHRWRELLELNSKIIAAWVGPAPTSGMLAPDETVRAYELHRYKVSASAAMDRQTNVALPTRGMLPGAKYWELPGDTPNMRGRPDAIKSFTERIEFENNHLAEILDGKRHWRTAQPIDPVNPPSPEPELLPLEEFEALISAPGEGPPRPASEITKTLPRKVRLA